jgi:TonB family protein
MKKELLITVLLLMSAFAFSQSAKCIRNYDKGTKAIESNNYQEGIRYLTLSIDEFPTSNAYFNRAAAYSYIGDTCHFCDDLIKASKMHDNGALNLFNENCAYSLHEEKVPDSIRLKNSDIISIEIISTKCNSDSIIRYVHENNGQHTSSIEINELDLSPVFTIVEEMPSFVGGEDARTRFLAMNIMYPEKATYLKIQGTVYVSFIINNEGFVTDVKILRGIGGGCDEEAARVVQMMPKWNPGRQNGKTVRVLFNMPIDFRIDYNGKTETVDYYGDALNYLQSGDTCKACKDLLLARNSDDRLAAMVYEKNCFNRDTLRMATNSVLVEYPGYSYTLVFNPKCNDEKGYSYVYNDKNQPINSIYDIMPEFPGGDIARTKFLQNNILYPKEAAEKGIEGTVYTSFEVKATGEISNIKILRGVGGGCTEEAIRVLKKMPKWVPATQKGKAVQVLFYMPISFSISR